MPDLRVTNFLSELRKPTPEPLVIAYFLSLRWRSLLEQGRKSGRVFAQPDLLIAASAIEHNLSVVTRNRKDFTELPDLKLLNPWEPRT